MTTLTELIDQLASGQLTTEQVTQQLTTIQRPPPAPRRATLAEIETDPDPEPDPPGSFAEIEQAYVDGRITSEQYSALADAAGH